jgi:hypothetical protein
MNLAVLKKTRRKPEVGDIFAMLPPDGRFLFGRVISTDANLLGFGGRGGVEGDFALIYIYSVRAGTQLPIPQLVREQMLIPPMITNRKAWTMGYFQHLDNCPVAPMDRLPLHCFVRAFGQHVDEMARPISVTAAPLRGFGVHSVRSIDDEVSKALGIPLAPD